MKRFSTGCVFYCFRCQLLHTCMILWLYIEKEIVHLRETTDTHIRFNERKKEIKKRNKGQGKQTWLSDNAVFGFNLIMTILVFLN